MGIRVWLDDKRPCPEGWVHARTAIEAIALLSGQSVDELALDHDLGHCGDCVGCLGYKSKCGCRCHWTGYSVALWMASTGRWPATKPTCHSSNPAGRANIEAIVERYFGTSITHPQGEFRLSWREQEGAEKFRKRHYETCKTVVEHPGFVYRFSQTVLGCRVSVVCLSCKRKKNVTDYGIW